MYRKYIKRILDIFLSGCALILLSWLYLLIVIAIKADSPGPVFFKQKRIGIHKTYFFIMKFRTMRTDSPHDVPTHLLDHPEKYITRVGKILRKTSLDELPQLVQVFSGKMSFFGPRPALWNQYDLIEERDKYGANDIRPGLSGWAQVSGRDTIGIEEKARFDGEYTANVTFKMDLKCFIETIKKVVTGVDIREGSTDSGDSNEAAAGEAAGNSGNSGNSGDSGAPSSAEPNGAAGNSGAPSSVEPNGAAGNCGAPSSVEPNGAAGNSGVAGSAEDPGANKTFESDAAAEQSEHICTLDDVFASSTEGRIRVEK